MTFANQPLNIDPSLWAEQQELAYNSYVRTQDVV